MIDHLIQTLIEINSEEISPGEGEKNFDKMDFITLRKYIEKTHNSKTKLNLNEKISIAHFLTSGKIWEEDLESMYKKFPVRINRDEVWIYNMIYQKVFGISANIRDCYDFNIGYFFLNCEKLDEKTDDFLLNYYESETVGGRHFKAGKVMKLLFHNINFKDLL